MCVKEKQKLCAGKVESVCRKTLLKPGRESGEKSSDLRRIVHWEWKKIKERIQAQASLPALRKIHPISLLRDPCSNDALSARFRGSRGSPWQTRYSPTSYLKDACFRAFLHSFPSFPPDPSKPFASSPTLHFWKTKIYPISHAVQDPAFLRRNPRCSLPFTQLKTQHTLLSIQRKNPKATMLPAKGKTHLLPV